MSTTLALAWRRLRLMRCTGLVPALVAASSGDPAPNPSGPQVVGTVDDGHVIYCLSNDSVTRVAAPSPKYCLSLDSVTRVATPSPEFGSRYPLVSPVWNLSDLQPQPLSMNDFWSSEARDDRLNYALFVGLVGIPPDSTFPKQPVFCVSDNDGRIVDPPNELVLHDFLHKVERRVANVHDILSEIHLANVPLNVDIPDGSLSLTDLHFTHNLKLPGFNKAYSFARLPFDRLDDLRVGEGRAQGLSIHQACIRTHERKPGLGKGKSIGKAWKIKMEYQCAFAGKYRTKIDVDPKHIQPGGRVKFQPKKLPENSKCRGCTWKFNAGALLESPRIALVWYDTLQHVNSEGQPAHSVDLAKTAGATHIGHTLSPWVKGMIEDLISVNETSTPGAIAEIVQAQVLDWWCLQTGLSKEELLNSWTERPWSQPSDFQVQPYDVDQVRNRARSAKWQFDRDSANSVRIYAAQNKGNFVLHWQPYRTVPFLPQKFIIVLQDPWQRDMLIEYGHGKMVHYDGTFSTNENMYTLNVLVVTDVEGHGIPVSYAICEGKDAESHVKVIECIIDNCKKKKKTLPLQQ
jgi:hypothetical protein